MSMKPKYTYKKSNRGSKEGQADHQKFVTQAMT